MTKVITIFLLIVAALASACARQGVPTVTVAELPPAPALMETPAVISVPGMFDPARALEYNRKLSVDIGRRVAGTPGGQVAADYIAGEFEKSGLVVTRQPFDFEGWEDRGTSVEVIGVDPTRLDAAAIQYSVGGNVEGQVVLVPGIGSRDDFAKVNVRGKVALVKRGTLSFAAKSQNAAEVGAIAILVYNDTPSIFSGTMREQVKIPTIGLSGTAGGDLMKRLANGPVQVGIKSDSGVVQRTGTNIVGTLKGKTDKTIVLGGHYDSVSAGPGAGDNGSGTATLLELARVMGSHPQSEHTLIFIAFDAEELGLLGSKAYVDNLSAQDLANMDAMLNFDMLGAGSGPLLLMGDGNTALLARSSASQLKIDARNGSLPNNAGSDHQSFARRGIDTVFFMRNYDLLHTPDDTMDQIKLDYLNEAGKVAQRLIERMDAKYKSDSSNLMPTE